MRAARIITAIIAFALLGLAPLASSSASAAPDTTSARAAKSVGVKIVKKNGNLIFVGNVKPAKKYKVTIQKATSCNVKKGTCNFKFYRTVSANKKGHFQTRVYAPTRGSWAWRARVGATTSDIWVTCKRKTASSPCPTP